MSVHRCSAKSAIINVPLNAAQGSSGPAMLMSAVVVNIAVAPDTREIWDMLDATAILQSV